MSTLEKHRTVSQVRATVLSHLRSPLSIEALCGDFGLRSRIVTLRHQSDDSDGAVGAAAGRVGGGDRRRLAGARNARRGSFQKSVVR